MKKYFCNKTNKNSMKTRGITKKTTFFAQNEFPVPLERLETMVLMGMDVPLAAIQRQIASAIDIIIHIGRLWDKSRKLLEIVEVMDYNGEEIDTRILYQFEETGREHGRIAGKWKKVQDLANTEKLFSAGYQTL